MGPKYLIIKKGEHGALLFHGNHVFFAPALPLEDVFDPTGAGDSFAGGFLGQLARSGDGSQGGLRRAIVYGSVVASFTVEDFGVKRLTDVSLAEIEERYQRFVQLTDFHS
jgi:sugar/nucleoside kinase (ribokinase family)